MRSLQAALLVVLALAASGCADGTLLLVDVRTDYRPGVEFDAVQTVIDAPAGLPPLTRETSDADDFLRGFRAARIEGLRGEVQLRVRLLSGGHEVAARPVIVDVAGRRAVTVALTRNCSGVECPRPDGDPLAAACLDGQCVPQTCTEEEATCVSGCSRDDECPATAPCTTGRCVEGLCYVDADDARCGEGSYCDPDTGCRPVDGTFAVMLESSFMAVASRAGRIVGVTGRSGVPVVVELAADGTVVAAVELGNGSGSDLMEALLLTSDGDVVLVGSDIGSATPGAIVVRLGAGLAVRSRAKVRLPGRTSGAAAVELPNGDVLVVGRHDRAEPLHSEVMAARVSPDGAVRAIWTLAQAGRHLDVKRAELTPTGELQLGIIATAMGVREQVLARTTMDLVPRWARRRGGGPGIPTAWAVRSGGGAALAFYDTSGEGYVSFLSPEGRLEGTHEIRRDRVAVAFRGMLGDDDDGVYVAGSVGVSLAAWRIDAAGSVRWAKQATTGAGGGTSSEVVRDAASVLATSGRSLVAMEPSGDIRRCPTWIDLPEFESADFVVLDEEVILERLDATAEGLASEAPDFAAVATEFVITPSCPALP